MGKTKGIYEELKQSKSLTAIAVYGFILLFILIVYPFLPLYEGESAFQAGMTVYTEGMELFLFITSSMLVHSVVLLVVFIVMLAKIRNCKACLGYSFYKLFRNTLVIIFAVVAIFQFSGSLKELGATYGIIYWYIVGGAYIGGLFLSLIAMLSNDDLRPTKFKGIYYFCSVLVCLVFLIVFMIAKENVDYQPKLVYSQEYGQEILDYSETEFVKGVYDSLIAVMVLNLVITVSYAILPINEPFGFMAGKCVRNKDDKITYFGPTFDILIYTVFFFIFGANGYSDELLVTFIPMIFVVAKYIVLGTYNHKAEIKLKKIREKLAEMKKFSFKKPEVKEEVAVQPVEEEINLKDYEVEPWDVESLINYNTHLDFKDKTSIGKMSDGLNEMFNDHGILIEKEQTQKILAGILSSKVTFVKCAPNRELIKTFSDTVSEFFAGETFIEERLNTEFDSASQTDSIKNEAVNLESQPITEENTATLEVATADAGETETTQTTVETQVEQTVEQVAQTQEVEAVEQVNEEQPETEIQKKKRLLQEAYELSLKNKYSIACGMFVANYIDNTFGMTFLNNTEQTCLSEEDGDVISAIALGRENVYVGKQEHCSNGEAYLNRVMKISDNVRLVVFINDKEQTPLEKEWIKYSTVVDLELIENKNATRELHIDSGTSYQMINESLEEAQDTCYLTEEYWRKLDRFEEFLAKYVDLKFDNKLLRQMEKSIAAFIACGMDRVQALDAVLSEKIIPLIAYDKEKILAIEDTDLTFKFDELFGIENIPFTKKAIVEYGLKK